VEQSPASEVNNPSASHETPRILCSLQCSQQHANCPNSDPNQPSPCLSIPLHENVF